MQAQAYEHPLKTGARRAVREIFLFWLIGAIACLPLIYHEKTAGSYDWLLGIPVGAIVAIPLWLLYRIIRFAVSR